MRTSGAIMSLVLLACGTVSAASAQGTPVSRQKNVELNSVAENQGNYDSPPVSAPRKFTRPGYDECLVALGTTYCRNQHGPWYAQE